MQGLCEVCPPGAVVYMLRMKRMNELNGSKGTCENFTSSAPVALKLFELSTTKPEHLRPHQRASNAKTKSQKNLMPAMCAVQEVRTVSKSVKIY